MKFFSRKSAHPVLTDEQLANMKGQLAAISKSQAVIELGLDGTVLTANENFLKTLGYTLAEIQGKHHSMFVEPAYRQSAEYQRFWERLGRGEFDAGQYKRLGKGGREIWIEATYNPILGMDGKPFKVVKYATDVTETKLRNADFEGQMNAINKSQAVISFALDGTILHANDNFLKAVGYSLNEIKGKHHGMFVEADYRGSTEYRQFWERLGTGEYVSGQFKRTGKGGRSIWIEASYNPILDLNGKPCKVVKFATDVTEQVVANQLLQAAVEQVQDVIGKVKDGDLVTRVPLDGKSGSIEQLCAGFNTLIDTMANLVRQVQDAAVTIDNASKEISQGNTDLSSRTEEQASSLEETASSMEELTSTVKQNAENANQANLLAVGASDVAVKGGNVVRQVVTTMTGISESSKKIADIIGVIDGIAFQTNILALNAAVEAARAGEQGRGFAVVATEVRNLAQRSANAAKEIKGLITDSVNRVDTGTHLVDEAGKTMDEIVSSVKRVTDIMAEITAATHEQSSGIQQVNQAITRMDEITQQNAGLVEEAAAVAESMQEQSGTLVQTLSAFNVGQSTERRSPQRATNVARLPAKPAAKVERKAVAPNVTTTGKKVVGADDDWQEF